jgi:hypothetical protein
MIYVTDKKRHLVCFPYTLENLHIMAEDLGIGKHWFHKDHYDIPKKRKEEIEGYCIVLHTKEIVKLVGRHYR